MPVIKTFLKSAALLKTYLLCLLNCFDIITKVIIHNFSRAEKEKNNLK